MASSASEAGDFRATVLNTRQPSFRPLYGSIEFADRVRIVDFSAAAGELAAAARDRTDRTLDADHPG